MCIYIYIYIYIYMCIYIYIYIYISWPRCEGADCKRKGTTGVGLHNVCLVE